MTCRVVRSSRRALVPVGPNRPLIELVGGDELLVALIGNPHLVVLEGQLEQRHDTILHELGGYRAAAHIREFLLDEPYVLVCLD
jgi:hypothetical protein